MMGLLILGMRVLEIFFMVGLAGSAVVVLISFVEDLRVLLHRDETKTKGRDRIDSKPIHAGVLPDLS